MNCLQCGNELSTQLENHLYDRDGIRATLVGVPVHRCSQCGDFEVEIPHLDELNAALVAAIVRKSAALSGHEIRFLRKSLGWSGVDFALHMGVAAETVSRWENGQKKMSSTADRLLRLMVTCETPIQHYSVHDLAKLGKEPGEASPPLYLKQSGDGWSPTVAA